MIKRHWRSISIGSVEIDLCEIMNPTYSYYTWPSAYKLSRYLYSIKDKVQNKSVLELGSGTGLCGFLCSKLGCSSVVVSDLWDEIVFENWKLMNIRNNVHVQMKVIEWGSLDIESWLSHQSIDFIIGSDVFYDPKCFESLIVSIALIFKYNPNATFLTVYHVRSMKRTIDHLLARWKLKAEILVNEDVLNDDNNDEDLILIKIKSNMNSQ